MSDKRKTRVSYPSSEKVYISGEINKIRVGMRRIMLTQNNPVIVYDTSGPYSDPKIFLDSTAGIPRIREEWFLHRKDIVRPKSDHLPYRGKEGKNLTQMSYAKRRIITPEMEYVAIRENQQIEDLGLKSYITPDFVRKEVAAGRAVIPANINHPEAEPMIIGNKFLVKINANIASPSQTAASDDVLEKMLWGCRWGCDTFMDLSIGKSNAADRTRLLRNCPVPVGSVPVYQALDKVGGSVGDLSWETYRDTLIEQAEQGVDFFTIHAALLRKHLDLVFPRLTGIESQGGSIMAQWMRLHKKENFLYTHFAEICEILKTYDVVLSIGDGLRAGSIYDANDTAQLAEMRVMGKLVDMALGQYVQVMTEGAGHLPMNKILENSKEQQYSCRNVPFYALGPITTDIASGYESVSSGIGAAMMAWYGASFICSTTSNGDFDRQRKEAMRESIIAYKIAAHAADLAKSHPGAQVRDNAFSKARFESRRKDQQNLSFDPERAAKYL